MTRNSRNSGNRRPPSSPQIVYVEAPKKKSHGWIVKLLAVLVAVGLLALVYANRLNIWVQVVPVINNIGHLGLLVGVLMALVSIVGKMPKFTGIAIAMILVGGMMASMH